MATELELKMAVDSESERLVPIYSGEGPPVMFALVIFRCPACGSTGKFDSWCEMHSPPIECVGQALRVKREPVLIPHAEPETTTTELYDLPDTEGERG